MDKRDAIEIATKYANLIKIKYENVKVVLLDSYAKGNFNQGSDIDITATPKDHKTMTGSQLKIIQLRRSIDSRIETHPFREQEFEIDNLIVNEIVLYRQELAVA